MGSWAALNVFFYRISVISDPKMHFFYFLLSETSYKYYFDSIYCLLSDLELLMQVSRLKIAQFPINMVEFLSNYGTITDFSRIECN